MRPLLSDEVTGALCDALKDHTCFLDPYLRMQIVNQLSFASNIPWEGEARFHLLRILHACSYHEFGFEELINTVLDEPDLSEFLTRLDHEFPQPISWVHTFELKRLLGSHTVIGFQDKREVLFSAFRTVAGPEIGLPDAPTGGNLLFRCIDDLAQRGTGAGRILLLVFLRKILPFLVEPLATDLKSLMQRIAAGSDTTLAKASRPMRTVPNKVRNTNPHLLIKVEAGSGGRYVLSAWLNPLKPRRLEVSGEEAPVAKTELPTRIEAYRIAALDALRHRSPNNDLVIHIFLPNELLGCDLDTWNVQVGASTFRPVGAHHPVVVRSYERAYNCDFLRFAGGRWVEKWRKLPPPPAPLTAAFLYAALAKSDLASLFDKLSQAVAFYSVVVGVEESITGLIDSATPVAIWPRFDATDAADDLRRLLCSPDFQSIPIRVREQRRSAHGNLGARSAWKSFVLLWDDPVCVPPDSPARFQSRGNR